MLLECLLGRVLTECEEERDKVYKDGASDADRWTHILPYFKIIEWSSLDSIHTTRGPSNLAMLVQLLEDNNKQHTQDNDVQGRTMVLGLFHSSPLVRSSCALRLRHELSGLAAPSEALVLPSEGGGSRDAFGEETDPFPPNGIICLSSLAVKQNYSYNQDSQSDVDKLARTWVEDEPDYTATHTDVRRLTDIALTHNDRGGVGEISGDGIASSRSNSSVQASALKQLRRILQRDNHLATTVDPVWSVTVAVRILDMLQTVSSSIDSAVKKINADLVAKRNEVGGSKADTWRVGWCEDFQDEGNELLFEDTLDDRRLCVELAATIKLFVTIFSYVRSSFSFHSSYLSQRGAESDSNRSNSSVSGNNRMDSKNIIKISPRVLLQRMLRPCPPSSATSFLFSSSSSPSTHYNRQAGGRGQVRQST